LVVSEFYGPGGLVPVTQNFNIQVPFFGPPSMATEYCKP
jgi:hypothetical protein